MSSHAYKPGEVAIRGEAIYRERIQQLVGTVEKGSFVAIDVETGDYEIDAGDAVATRIRCGIGQGVEISGDW